MSASIEVVGEGIRVELGSGEAALISQVPEVVKSLGGGDDPAMERLRPPVAPGDPKIDDNWWQMVGDDLSQSREVDAGFVAKVVPGDEAVVLDLKPEEAEALLRTVNHARLVIAARMGIAYSDDAEAAQSRDDPVLDFLGWMVELLTHSLSELQLGDDP